MWPHGVNGGFYCYILQDNVSLLYVEWMKLHSLTHWSVSSSVLEFVKCECNRYIGRSAVSQLQSNPHIDTHIHKADLENRTWGSSQTSHSNQTKAWLQSLFETLSRSDAERLQDITDAGTDQAKYTAHTANNTDLMLKPQHSECRERVKHINN